MTQHSIFLRSGCILPDHLDLLREPFGESWTHIEEIESPAFDAMIRRAGWHFMWIQGPCSRRGFGLTEERAIHRALARALKSVARRFNAAEFDSLQITKCPGFYIANVTMEPRQIQQNTSLDVAYEGHPQAVPAR